MARTHRPVLAHLQGLGIGIALGAVLMTVGDWGIYLAAFGAAVLITTGYAGEKLLAEVEPNA